MHIMLPEMRPSFFGVSGIFAGRVLCDTGKRTAAPDKSGEPARYIYACALGDVKWVML